MNKVLVVLVAEDNTGKIDAGGIELSTIEGVREALSMAEFAKGHLTEVLVQMRAKALAAEMAMEEDPAAEEEVL